MIATCYNKSYLKLTNYHLLEVSIYYFQTSADWKPLRMKSGIERISVLSKAKECAGCGRMFQMTLLDFTI